jgi:hypothetical protein
MEYTGKIPTNINIVENKRVYYRGQRAEIIGDSIEGEGRGKQCAKGSRIKKSFEERGARVKSKRVTSGTSVFLFWTWG